MSAVVAIDISDDLATLVAGTIGPQESITLLKVRTVPIEELFDEEPEQPATEAANDASESDDSSSEEVLGEDLSVDTKEKSKQAVDSQKLESILGIDIDSSVGVLSGREVIYRTYKLPFASQKKIDQIAPLQLEDELPFELDEFLLDNRVLLRAEDGEYEVMSTLIPSGNVANGLSTFSLLGSDPKILTTKASALTGIAEHVADDVHRAYGIIEVSAGRVSLAIFIDGEARRLRDLALIPNEDNTALSTELFSQLNCTLTRVENELDASLGVVYVVSDSNFFTEAKRFLRFPVESLDFGHFVHNQTDEDVRIDNLSWAIGLLSLELFGRGQGKTELVDFRQGVFAYKPAWRNFWNATQTEIVPIVLALLTSLLWFASVVYTNQNELQSVESRIEKLVSVSIPEVKVPYRAEVRFLEDETARIEEQLRGMGSLSSLSPLESLNVLSQSIGKDIDISVDAVNIAQSRLSFRGSVLDNPSVGRLSSVLEKQGKRFCSVKVDPKGRVPGSSRVKFTADIELCE